MMSENEGRDKCAESLGRVRPDEGLTFLGLILHQHARKNPLLSMGVILTRFY